MSPTQTPNRQDDDTRYNPSAEGADEIFNRPDMQALNDQGDSIARNHDSLRDAEHNPDTAGAGAANKTKTPSLAEKAAVGTAATAADRFAPGAGKAVKYLAKLKSKKGGALGLIIGGLIAIVALGSFFIGPGLVLVGFKEAMSSAFNDTLASMEERSNFILKKRLSGVTSGCTTKIACRYTGMSKKQIASLERSGIKVNVDTEASGVRKARVGSLELPDGTRITASNFSSTFNNDVQFRKQLRQAYNPKYAAYSDRVFSRLAGKLKITKQKNLTGTNKEDLDKSMRSSISGEQAADGGGRPRQNGTDADGRPIYVDANGNQIDEAAYNRLNAGIDELESSTKSVAESGKKAAISITRTGALTTVTAGLGVVDGMCTGYRIVEAVGYGAKLVGMQQLIRFAFTVMNTADAIPAQAQMMASSADGYLHPQEVEYVGNKLTARDEDGLTATDSFGYKYAAYGDLAIPADKEKQGKIFQFTTAAGFGAAITDFIDQVNEHTDGAPRTACGFIKNPWVQGGLIVGGIAAIIFSGGTSLGPGTAAAIGVVASLGLLYALAEPTLINLAAGTLVTPDTQSTEAGNAVTAGMGALNAQNSQAHGLSPLTKDVVLAYDRKTDVALARQNKVEALSANHFDIMDPRSASHKFALAVVPQINASTRNVGSILTAPLNILSSSVQSLTPVSRADLDPMAQYEICQDFDYNHENLAADPFCNIRFGLDPRSLALDPETVATWMYDNDYVDENGATINDTEYSKFLSHCVDRTLPYGYEDVENSSDTDGSECVQSNPGYNPDYDYFRIYYLDTSIVESMDGEAITTSTASPPVNSTPTTGDSQSLAQQIIDSGRVDGADRYMAQIQAYADGDTSCNINPNILQLILTASQEHTVYITSLNRFCTSTSAGAGTNSLHYRDGGGHAVDFGIVDGTRSSGGSRNDLALLNFLMPTLPSGAAIGQSNCRSSRLALAPGIREHRDTCNHIHISVPVR